MKSQLSNRIKAGQLSDNTDPTTFEFFSSGSLPHCTAVYFSNMCTNLGRVSFRLRELSILVVAWPSFPGETAAMILLLLW